MCTLFKEVLLFAILQIFTLKLYAQPTDSITLLRINPNKLFKDINAKSTSLTQGLDRTTNKYLARMIKREKRLKANLWKKDSGLAKQLFPDIDGAYEKLKASSGKQGKYQNVYSGHLDSLTTALSFLRKGTFTNTNLDGTLTSLQDLQSGLNKTELIRKYLAERKKFLQEQFEKLGMASELKRFKKEVYYYGAQVREYRSLYEEPSKLEAKLMEVLIQTDQFKDFFAHSSLLSSLFRLPGSSNSADATASLAGLQTRATINQTLADRFGNNAQSVSCLQQNMQAAQSRLNKLKQKALSLGTGAIGSAEVGDLPDFKPNGQRTKSFLQRLEIGTNLQTQKGSNYFPVSSDIGLSLGYKLNDRSIVGVGTAFKMGWGSSFNNISITAQGIGLRSFLDYKLKGSFYVSGGYEMNYRSLVTQIDQLKQYSAWAPSGLFGISKRYQVNKKLKGEMKLLWDFLSYQQRPVTQPIVFRIGYSFR